MGLERGWKRAGLERMNVQGITESRQFSYTFPLGTSMPAPLPGAALNKNGFGLRFSWIPAENPTSRIWFGQDKKQMIIIGNRNDRYV